MACDHGDEKVIAADFATILADPALADLRDGPAKTFLVELSTYLDYDEDETPPVLVVRR